MYAKNSVIYAINPHYSSKEQGDVYAMQDCLYSEISAERGVIGLVKPAVFPSRDAFQPASPAMRGEVLGPIPDH